MDIANEIALNISNAVGPEQITKLVTKSINDAVGSYSSKQVIEKALAPAIEQAAKEFARTNECRSHVKEQVLLRIDGMLESVITDVLSKLVATLKAR